jgi:hypothetical protein
LVFVPPPPPGRAPAPLFRFLQPGARLFRLFNPIAYGTTALSFRHNGPRLRFDHHRHPTNAPRFDPDRGIYYAALTLSSCVVEVFGDTGIIECGDWHVAHPELTRRLRLLNLRGRGAMRAGSVAALAKAPDHSIAQAWSRYFYDNPAYRDCGGILYSNAHNDETAIALYERAGDALVCGRADVLLLDDFRLQPVLARIAERHGLVWSPGP